MFLMLIATFAIGFASAGVVMLVFRIIGKKTPRPATPLAAGLAMFSFMIWNEYTWYERALHSMPEDVVIASSYRTSSIFHPWTLIWPRVNRFAAVDLGAARRNPEFPDQMLTQVLLVARFETMVKHMELFDCAGMRRADAPDNEQMSDWTPDWIEPGPDDPLLKAACGG